MAAPRTGRAHFLPASLCLAAASLLGPATAAPLRAQTPVPAAQAPDPRFDFDPQIAAAIARIPLFDNHAHVVKVVPPGGLPDSEYDALPVDGLEPADDPVGFRSTQIQLIPAWKALWGYRWDDMDSAHVAAMLSVKERIRQEKGDAYPTWVLDQAGIQTIIANRVAMGRGLNPPRFQWASYVDALLLPLPPDSARRPDHDSGFFYGKERRLLARYMRELGVGALPPTLDEYLASVVTPTLERQRKAGAIAVKFEAAYLRKLDFDPASKADAARIYARYVPSGEPDAAEYKTLEDYIFRYIAREAGRLGMAVHLHTGAGAGAHFDLAGSNPHELESALDDPALLHTNFVFIHGGWPYQNETAELLGHKNAYADFSNMTLTLPTRALAAVLRTWLEWHPEKIMFGSDAFALAPQFGWEEGAWLSAHKARTALAMALTGMMRDGEITRERALELARMVMNGNAHRLYHLQ